MNETDSVDLLCGNQQEEDYIVTMTEKIKLEICFDTQIQLYPLKVEQNPKGNYDVFKAKCRSFECEEYHLGEYVGPRLSYCKNSQSWVMVG